MQRLGFRMRSAEIRMQRSEIRLQSSELRVGGFENHVMLDDFCQIAGSRRPLKGPRATRGPTVPDLMPQGDAVSTKFTKFERKSCQEEPNRRPMGHQKS